MFYIFGAKDCIACKVTCLLLDDFCEPYKYIDLGDNWRTTLKNNNLKSIPLIFKVKHENLIPSLNDFISHDTPLTFKELEAYLNAP